MSSERKKPVRKPVRAAKASLHQALNDLEQILEKQRPAPRTKARPGAQTRSGEQYDIPLLHDVVTPGGGAAEEPSAGYESPGVPRAGSSEYEEACRILVAKIANEIEVIVQARIEAALQSATDEIRKQVKNHIEIMLPEILDEIAQERAGRRK